MEGKFTVFMLLFGAVVGIPALEDDGMLILFLAVRVFVSQFSKRHCKT